MSERAGEKATSFDAFYAATVRRVTHAVYAMCADLTEAQDCAQEAYTRAWQRWSSVRGLADPEAWVRTVARRVAISRWRRVRTGIAALARHGPPRHESPPDENHVALVAALRLLPPAQRHAVVLHHLVGLRVDEIAQETGVPEGTVKARLSRGRAALASLLDDSRGTGDEPQEVWHAR